MKLHKIAFLLAFISIQPSLFGMFLDAVLQCNTQDSKENLYNSNLALTQNLTLSYQKQRNVPEICAICKDPIKQRNDWIKIQPCEDIVHASCLIEWSCYNDWSQCMVNKSRQCPLCDQNFEIKDIAWKKQLTESLAPSLKIALEKALQPVIRQDQIYLPETKESLLKKSVISLLIVLSRIATTGKIMPLWLWHVSFAITMLGEFLEYKYGLMSSYFHTADDVQVKLLGKLLYLAISRIIPMYLLNGSLKKPLWEYIKDAYNTMNTHTKLPMFRFRKN